LEAKAKELGFDRLSKKFLSDFFDKGKRISAYSLKKLMAKEKKI
jgi:hypothetical protein